MKSGNGQQGRGNGSMNAYLATGILVLALLRVGDAIFVPLVVSLFIIALVWPIQAALQRFLPRLLALFVTLSTTIAIVVAVGSSVVWGAK